MKRYLIPFVFLLILVFVLSGSFLWWQNASSPLNSKDTTKQSFLVTRGMSAEEVGEKLYELELIKSSFAFKLYVQLTGKASDIQAGEFVVSPSFSIAEVVDSLSGPPAELWVTIPEGLRREEIAERFIEGLEKSNDADRFRSEFLAFSSDLEGYLFPDTYLFPREASASAVVARMNSLFKNQTSNLAKNDRVESLSSNQLVTLASIIERETKSDSERPIVAGVFVNRLEEGMALQADATVQYALANTRCRGKIGCDWWVAPLSRDLEVDSPFNTYKYPGIPPAPIANPGLSSLRAAFNPARTDYFYYIHDRQGEIHFARTLAEHNQNIAKHLDQ
jgi:UPF0755 protein